MDEGGVRALDLDRRLRPMTVSRALNRQPELHRHPCAPCNGERLTSYAWASQRLSTPGRLSSLGRRRLARSFDELGNRLRRAECRGAAQGHRECAAVPDDALDGQRSLLGFDQRSGDSQAQSGAPPVRDTSPR